jgi:general secretion pathway protein B
MSFILNALRKSEQERQALQSEAVTDKILASPPPQNRSKATKLLAFLFIANVLVIAGIVWLVRNNLISKSEVVVSPQIPVQETTLEPKAIAKSTQLERSAQPEESEITSIAELIDKDKPEPVPAPLPAKPTITKEMVAKVIEQPVIANHSEPQIQITPAIAPVAKAQADEPETIAVTTDIPFLSDLPIEFRQTVPKFTINVFVYSQDPEERFVMIDMVKYKPGQQIKDAMQLKEIRRDSIVVDYQNQAFKIKRP